MTTHLPSVSIVIPAYNEARIIRRCIIAALHQTVAPHEIIVVDNLSTDDTVEVVRDLMGEFPQSGIRLVHQSLHQGIIPTRNYGFNAATGDVIGRIDADSIVDHEWVEAVQTVFADEEVMAATGPVSCRVWRLRLRPNERTALRRQRFTARRRALRISPIWRLRHCWRWR